MVNNGETRVTIRVKKELHDEFKIIMNRIGSSISSNLIEHINKQVNEYELIESNLVFSNLEYKKINVYVNSELYKKYKIKLIENNTTPTADIIRHMQYVVETLKEIF